MGKLDYKSQPKEMPSQPESSFSQYLHIPIELSSHLSARDQDRFWFQNRAVNPSLSYTLPHFVTQVCLKKAPLDKWIPFENNPFKQSQYFPYEKLNLSQKEQERFVSFFKFLKRFFKIPGHYEISSENNFPKGGGMASSASSFAALTFATYKLAQEKSLLEKQKFNAITKQVLAHLSRVGSGSSCRSFFSPWCVWSSYQIYIFSNSFEKLDHQLILTQSAEKKISSSLAHEKVKTSPRFKNRPEKTLKRMNALKSALKLGDWESCFKLSKEEFLDMHSLFESSKPPFSYQNKNSLQVIDLIDDFWKKRKEGPIITMDAGSNIHLLYQTQQKAIKAEINKELKQFKVSS